MLRNYAVILVVLALGSTDLPKRVAEWLLVGAAKDVSTGQAVGTKMVDIQMPASRGRLIFATVARAAYLVLVFIIAM